MATKQTPDPMSSALVICAYDPFGEDGEPMTHQQLYEVLSRYIWVEYISINDDTNEARLRLKRETGFSYTNLIEAVNREKPTTGTYILVDYGKQKWVMLDGHPLG